MKKAFTTQVAKLADDRVYMYHLIIPEDIVAYFKAKKQKRLLCQVNDLEVYHSAMLSLKNGYNYINLNKERLKEGKLKVGDAVQVCLEADTSEYGMPLPIEMEELFDQDGEAKKYFDLLTPGKKRSLLYLVGKVKSQDKRIEKALIIAQYLKTAQGTLDFKALHQAFKDGIGQ